MSFMNNIKKIVFTLFLSLSTCFVSYAATVHQNDQKQVSNSRISLQQKNLQVQGNNFTNQNENGQSICKGSAHDYKTCVPIYNSASVAISVTPEGNDPNSIPAQAITIFGNKDIASDSLNFVIVNSSTNEKIFDGTAKNKVGLYCSESACKPWN